MSFSSSLFLEYSDNAYIKNMAKSERNVIMPEYLRRNSESNIVIEINIRKN